MNYEYENGKRLNSVDSRKAFQISDPETIFEINNFVKVRENYFNRLKKVICENCNKCWDARVPENLLEQLSLSLEQPVLLACLKREIYQILMREMIFKIKKLTGEGVLHLEIKMMLEKISKETDLPFEFKNIRSESADVPLTSPRGGGTSSSEGTHPENGRIDIYDLKTEEDENNGEGDRDDVRADIIDILENDDRNLSRNSVNFSDRNFVKNGDKRNEKIFKPKSKQTVWKHERIIQMHNMSLLLSRKSEEERLKNEIIFLDLFGEDSDVDEGECPDEIYRRSCSERISALVVKHLMPYYRESRVLGRTVFKKLGCFISEQMLQVTEYPDEQYVKYFVAKFFRNKKVYKCEGDVLHVKFS